MTDRSLKSCTLLLTSLLAACVSNASLPLLRDSGQGDRAQPDVVQSPDATQSPDAANSPDTKQSPDALQLEGVLIDDFENGNDKTTYLEAGWYSFDDKINGGGSSIAFTGVDDGSVAMNGSGFESDRSLEVNFTFDQGSMTYSAFLGWGAAFGTSNAPLDVSQFVGIGYTYRGRAHRVRIETFEVKDYDYMGMDVAEAASWTTVVVPFTQLSQEGWGAKVTFNPQNMGNLAFQVRESTGTQSKVDIDNLMFLTRLPDQKPDMTVMPPNPPTDDPIPSITVTHPGQAKALAYLNRGYNITNWLEQDRFTGFTYDEAYVTKLAAAGFKALRLPVDLDRYIVSSSGSGDMQDVVVHDDLFTVLDSFIEWTAKAGMSLTIDYHKYSNLLDMANPDSIAKAVAVWGKVAARYASNSREDLFYELLNEPEVSFTGTPPTQSQWTAIAERMITAIRTSDTAHTLIFGDVQWYGISALATRKPLSDGNVIYAFHNYEPFIFTHQGASWAGMTSTHDLPYPYAAERWSAYFGDLGFNTSMESWILSAARDYYETGNRSSIRNQYVQAKRWAVDNNVPVICNEFGAYDRTSRLEDRARYLTDAVSIFEELEIPWQQWFMIMDAAGTVVPEYRTALGLDK
jgi:licheninase